MREYNFRGKPFEDVDFDNIGVHISKDDFVYGNLIVDGEQAWIVKGVIESTNDYITLEEWIPVRPETVGQYTGLKDKNNNMIYEGDIIRYTDKNKWYQVESFNMMIFGYDEAIIEKVIEEKPYHEIVVEIPSIYQITELYEYEIIGTIHDKENV